MSSRQPGRQGRLVGKVAVITGTASGQGRAAACAFAREGATVVGCDLDLDGAAATVAAVRAAGGTADNACQVDLTDENAVAAWAADVGTAHGRVDVLYANAAATRFAPVEEISYADWQWNFRHEVDVVFLPVRAFWPLLAAAEGAPAGIRVNCVSPGMIRTPATESSLLTEDHPMRAIAGHIPLGRVGEAEEVAACALFLASEEASYVTGTNLMVDGGWSAVLPG